MEKNKQKEIISPGEIIAEGEDFLPGDWTIKVGDKIISTRLGVADKSERIVKVVPISGVYIPRRGNTVIGEVVDLNQAGWMIDIKGPYSAFLPMRECPMFIRESEMESYLSAGDLVAVKVLGVKRGGVDLTTKFRGLGKIREGIIIEINPHRVPRVIGKEGSMIRIIKDATGCDINVGQNGIVWVRGSSVEHELFAKSAIDYVVTNTISEGLTDMVEVWLKDNKPKGLVVEERSYDEEEEGEEVREERGDRRENEGESE